MFFFKLRPLMLIFMALIIGHTISMRLGVRLGQGESLRALLARVGARLSK